MKPPEQAPPLLSALALFAILFAVLFALVDINLTHPGLAWPDEVGSLRFIQEWREGQGLPWTLFKGCLNRWLVAMGGGLGRPSQLRLHIPAFLAFFVESAALFSIARRHFSESAAFFALIINALAAFTLLRLRSVLSYGAIPAELLVMLAMMPHARSLARSLLWGFAAGLLLLEYEAWALALGVLAIAYLVSNERPALTWSLLGFACGAGLVLAVSWPDPSDYLLVRRAQSFGGNQRGHITTIVGNLKGFLFGAEALPNFGVSRWPSFPMGAWPGLFVGLGLALRQKRWIVAWIGLGMIPLISGNSYAEPQRLIVAWPALCMVAGAGYARLVEEHGRVWVLIAVLVVAGATAEALAYETSMMRHYGQTYGYSVNLKSAARLLKERSESAPLKVLTELDNEGMGMLRFTLDAEGVKQSPQGAVAAIVPWEYAYGLEKQGSLQALSLAPGAPPVLLYFPNPAMAARLQRVENELAQLWRAAPPFRPRAARQVALAYLNAFPQCDPWVKSACYEQALGQSFMIGDFPPAFLGATEKANLQSASALVWAAQRLRATDPAAAARLDRRAAAIDPRRGPH